MGLSFSWRIWMDPEMTLESNSRLVPVLGMMAVLLLTVIIYAPGLQGIFLFDSRSNIVTNQQLHLENLDWEQFKAAALSNHSGKLGRPIATASFALNHIFSRLDPYDYKLTNLAIHCINGLLVFFLTLKLLKSLHRRKTATGSTPNIELLALCVSAVWLLHPINLTSVLYVVQRMNSLSAMFVLAGLISYVAGRQRSLDSGTCAVRTFALPVMLTVLAALSKENGVLLPVFMLIIESTVFRFRHPDPKFRRLLYSFYLITLALPAIGLFFVLAYQADLLLGGYAIRDFTLSERLLTEARVLWFYIGLIVTPNNLNLGLFHDDITVSRSLFEPSTTLPAVIGIFALLGIALYSRARAPILSLGLVFFLAGHLLESTIFPLEIAHEHRNYLPGYGLVLIILYYLLYPNALPLRPLAGRTIAAIFMGLLAVTTAARANYWSDRILLSRAEAAHHPTSPRATVMLGGTYGLIAMANENRADEFYGLARDQFLREAELSPHSSSGLFELIMLSAKLGKPVDPGWITELKKRLSHGPIQFNSVNLADSLVNCQLKGTCNLQDKDVIAILQAALSNPAAKRRVAAELYTITSKYALFQLNDQENALFLIARAAEAMPHEPTYRLHLASLLVTMGRIDDARAELGTAARLDKLGKSSVKIQELEGTIARIMGM